MIRFSRVRFRWRHLALGLSFLLLLLSGFSRYYFGHLCYARLAQEVSAGRTNAPETPSDLEYALNRWPDSPQVHMLAARYYRIKGDITQCVQHLTRVKELCGSTAEMQVEYQLLRAQTGEVDEVAATLETLVEDHHPDSLLILETVARAYMNQHRYSPAIIVLNRWIQLFPTQAMPHFWRGWVLERMHDVPNAKLAYETAIELDPQLWKARLRLVELFLADIRPREARPHLERLNADLPDNPDVLARLGICYFLEGDLKTAESYLRSVVDRTTDNSTVPLMLGRIEMQKDQPKEAEAWLRKALAIDSGDTEAMFALSNCLAMLGRDAEAASMLKHYHDFSELLKRANDRLQVEARKPSKDPQDSYIIGDLLLQVGQEKSGLYWLNHALELDPRHPATLARLASYYEMKKNTNPAATKDGSKQNTH